MKRRPRVEESRGRVTPNLKTTTGWLVAFAACAGLGTPTAHAERDTPFVYAARGPGVGKGAISLGGRVYLPVSSDPFVPIPLFELNYVRGLASIFDFELHVNSLLIASIVETGVRIRAVDTKSFSIALRANGLLTLLAIGGSSGGAAAAGGASPGVIASFGGDTQISLSFDVPMIFGVTVSGIGSGSGFAYLLRPGISAEFPVGEDVNLYFSMQLYMSTQVDFFALPTLGVGAAW